MPGVMMRFLRASAAFIADAERPGFTMTNSLSACATPGVVPETHVVPWAFERSAGTNTFHAPLASIYRNGFSRTTGTESIVVYGGCGKLSAGAPRVPTNTMFQFAPVQLPS